MKHPNDLFQMCDVAGKTKLDDDTTGRISQRTLKRGSVRVSSARSNTNWQRVLILIHTLLAF